MSGIAGIFNLDGRPVEQATLQQMTATLSHRGPDAEAMWVMGPVGLGHRQLMTTPESLRERQPISLDNGNYAIVCDGRVDNREELIQSLRHFAPVGADTCDAELILRAYIKWDADCLKWIIGDFAFVIWDAQRQKLFCARDPMGIRTFYYYRDDERFVFASDIRAILADARMPRELDQLKVALYLLNRYAEAADQTFFKGILQILPATHMVVTRKGIAHQSYWQPSPWDQISYPKLEEYIEHFLQLFYEAVRCRLRSFSPVGISLSGGMDSTSIACTAAHLIATEQVPDVELWTISSVFRDFPRVDESEYIRHVLNAWNLREHFVYADDLWGFKPLQRADLLSNQPYPVPFRARHEAILQYANRAGIRVIMTGEGGDELFNPGFGYLVDLLGALRVGRLLRELFNLTPRSRREFYKTVFWALVPAPVRRLYGRLRSSQGQAWLNRELVEHSGALARREALGPPRRGFSNYCRSMYQSLVVLARVPFLSYVTEMYAAHAIEARHPFLDLRVVDFLSRVPAHLKFALGWNKLLLRRAMEGLVPDEVRLRPTKTAFTDVLDQGVRREKERIEAALERGYLVTRGWVSSSAVRASLERFLAGDMASGSRLNTFITLEDWLSHNFGSNSSEALANVPLVCP